MTFLLHAGLQVLLATAALAASTKRLMGRAAPNIYLAGDSTMADGGGGTSTEGWGVYFQDYVTGAAVINHAIAGRSARSYTVEGRFDTIAKAVTPGDIVVIEFGHNDGGSLSTTDNGRTDCGGTGNETCTTPAGVVVQNFVTYIASAAKAMIANGAKVIISSQTPNNVCESTTCSYAPSRFVGYASIAAEDVGSNAWFVDHGQYMANAYITLGKTVVDKYYPEDHTHTSPAGANVSAAAFVKAVYCAGMANPLTLYLKNTTNIVRTCI